MGRNFDFGFGMYTSPDPKLAEQFTGTFKHWGYSYKMIVMCRCVNNIAHFKHKLLKLMTKKSHTTLTSGSIQ